MQGDSFLGPDAPMEVTMPTRRVVLQGAGSALALGLIGPAWAQPAAKGPDRILICNEDSNTLSVIDPASNAVAATINLPSFDEDPRPPFRYVTGGVSPTHLAMPTGSTHTQVQSSRSRRRPSASAGTICRLPGAGTSGCCPTHGLVGAWPN